MTLTELSGRIGVTEATLLRYESGTIRNPKRERITALAKALDVTEAALMGWDHDDLDADIRVLARELQELHPEKRRRVLEIMRLVIRE